MVDTIPEIRFETYIENPNKPGYLSCTGPKTKDDITRQIENTLKAIEVKDYTAYDAAEWISMEGKWEPSKWFIPKHGAPIVYYRHGNSEGFIITICLIDNTTGAYHNICNIKFLTDEDMVHNTVRHLIKACHDGLFGIG